jgi:hypothetical protein
MVRAPVSSTLLSFIPRSLKVTRAVATPERVTIEAAPRSTSAACPVRCNSSWRVHSSYQRVLHDLPWQGSPSDDPHRGSPFSLSEPPLRSPYICRASGGCAACFRPPTGRLRDLQHHLGLALGGEAGARLATRISAPISPDTLLRLASARRPTAMVPVPRVLGIDDWAELAKVPTA